jgi:hypothetical protein
MSFRTGVVMQSNADSADDEALAVGAGHPDVGKYPDVYLKPPSGWGPAARELNAANDHDDPWGHPPDPWKVVR